MCDITVIYINPLVSSGATIANRRDTDKEKFEITRFLHLSHLLEQIDPFDEKRFRIASVTNMKFKMFDECNDNIFRG